MFAFDCSVMIVTGQTFALAARRQLTRKKYLSNKYLVISILWAALIHIPTAVCHFFGWTAWNVGYWFDPFPPPLHQPSYFAIVISWLHNFLCTGLFVGAFLLTHKLIKAKKIKWVLVIMALVVVLLFTYWGVFFQRNFTITTWENFQILPEEGINFSWGGISFFGHVVMWINVVLAFVDFVPLALLCLWFNREGKKLAVEPVTA